MTEKFKKLVDHFNDTGELGHYNEERNLICLYDIENTKQAIHEITNEVYRVCKEKFKLIVLNPERETTNINILDIDV